MFQGLAEGEDKEKYQKFWKNYGTNIKLGVIEDPSNRVRLSKLLMFHSSKTSKLTTLQEYVDRMKEGQEQIYFLAGENLDQVSNSPLLERLVKRGFEVLYMVNAIDEYAVSNMEKFDGKYKLTNIAREGLKFDGEEETAEQDKEQSEQFSSLTTFLKKVLGNKIDKAIVSNRLTQSPSALVSAQHGWTANMERIVKAQALGDANKANQFYIPKKILEINPRHPLIKELNNRVASNPEDETTKGLAELIYETASLTSGFSLEDPTDLANKIIKMMSLSVDVDPNTKAEEEPEPRLKSFEKKEDIHDEL